MALDAEDGKTRNSKARPGRRAINEDRNARALEARQGSRALDASKSHHKTKEAARHPAYWGSRTHRRALKRGRERLGPQGQESGGADAWVQAKGASYAQKKPNHAAQWWDTQPPRADGAACLGGVVWACH